MDKLNKRVVLVTGATGGLGTAMCKKLFNEGFHVVGNYRDKNKAEIWQNNLLSEGYKIELYEADVTQFESVKQMIEKIETEIGPIDTLVNNAGTSPLQMV